MLRRNIADRAAVPAQTVCPCKLIADMRELTTPLIHIPLYCWDNAPYYSVLYMIQLHLACLDSYFAHENTYDLLVTTNDERPLEVLSAYKEKSKHRFEVRFVSRHDLLSTFCTDESRLMDVTCMRTVFSKFYPILNQECDAIVHVDFDTIFVSKIDLSPLLVSDVGLVDTNRFHHGGPWCPTRKEADFFSIQQPVEPVAGWINTGVFSVQRGGFDLCRTEVQHYLENLERVIADELAGSDELIMNALAVRQRDTVTVIPDYRYNFLAYYLKHDPTWTSRGQIVHFHSLKPPGAYCYVNGAVEHQCDAFQALRLSEDFYLAVLMWFRHLHAACRQLPYEFPMLARMPLEVVEKELAHLVAQRDAGMFGVD